MSAYVDLGFYYDFVPIKDCEMKFGTKNELLPKPHQCKLQKQLQCFRLMLDKLLFVFFYINCN